MPVPFEPSFQSLRVRSFSLSDLLVPPTTGFHCTISTSFTAPAETGSQIVVSQRIEISSGADGTQQRIVELLLEANFDIPNRSLVWSNVRPRILLKTILAGLVASTARGILFGRLANSFLSEYMIPVMDPKEFFILEEDEANAYSEDLESARKALKARRENVSA